MNGQILRKYQQKKLNLMRVTCKKTRNYVFSLLDDKWRENWISKNKLLFYFRGQNETEYNRISIFYYNG